MHSFNRIACTVVGALTSLSTPSVHAQNVLAPRADPTPGSVVPIQNTEITAPERERINAIHSLRGELDTIIAAGGRFVGLFEWIGLEPAERDNLLKTAEVKQSAATLNLPERIKDSPVRQQRLPFLREFVEWQLSCKGDKQVTESDIQRLKDRPEFIPLSTSVCSHIATRCKEASAAKLRLQDDASANVVAEVRTKTAELSPTKERIGSILLLIQTIRPKKEEPKATN